MSTGTTAVPAAAPPRRHAAFHSLRVREVTPLTDDSVAVTFEVPPGLAGEYDFIQGQHLALMGGPGGDGVRRSYSICSPAGSGVLQIAVKHVPGGVFSSYALHDLRPGDVLDVMTPSGRFFTPLDPANAKHYVAVVAGSGITPVLSIVATTLSTEPRSSVTLVYGNRTTSSIMFLEEIEDLKNRYPSRLTLLHVLSREQRETGLLSGRLDGAKVSDLLDALLPPDTVDEWFLCGPFGMVEEVRETLLARGVAPRHVHRELFHTGPEPARRVVDELPGAAGAATVTVLLDGRTTSFPLSASGSSILDATLAVRADAPYACKGGVCGTCRAKLVEGTVRMVHNYALEADEQEAGFVLACQSHPTSERVTLDFDQ